MGDIYDMEGEAYWKARCEELEARVQALESKVANYRHNNFILKKKIDHLEKKLKGAGIDF